MTEFLIFLGCYFLITRLIMIVLYLSWKSRITTDDWIELIPGFCEVYFLSSIAEHWSD